MVYRVECVNGPAPSDCHNCRPNSPLKHVTVGAGHETDPVNETFHLPAAIGEICRRSENDSIGILHFRNAVVHIVLNSASFIFGFKTLIARNAAAFGVQALIVDDATYDPYYRKAVRVSTGAIFRLPVYYEDDLGASLIQLKKKYDTRIIAATPGRGASDISKVKLSGNICFVFGNEDKGISRRVLSVADAKVRIPILEAVDSLNVASAGAICLYEASCHRSNIKNSGGTILIS